MKRIDGESCLMFLLLAMFAQLLVFTIPAVRVTFGGYDGFEVVMTSVFGRAEQVMDVVILVGLEITALATTILLLCRMLRRKKLKEIES